MQRSIRNICREQGGNTLAIMAAALLPIMALIGSGLDLGVTYMARAKLQNACDASVLAGRQNMQGTVWTTADKNEATKFFEFNFPENTHDVTDLEFSIQQNANDRAELLATASANVPTSLMHIFGFQSLPIAVSCDAKRDLGHNDVMLVLDVTGSMAFEASGGGGTRISRLRNGAIGIYRALQDDSTSITRFGIVPYSHTVNVARRLRTRDILRNQEYVDGHWTYTYCDTDTRYIWNCQNLTSETQPVFGFSNWNTKYTYNIAYNATGSKIIGPVASSWSTNNNIANSINAFRASGDGCIEERPSVGNAAFPVRYNSTITDADINNLAATNNDAALQFGRYDPAVQEGQSQVGCPSEAIRLRTFNTESAFQTSINNATARVTGGTYHDVGLLWGTRFLSRDGFFAAANPDEIDDIPVSMHIVFMTDGMLDTGARLYSAHGVEQFQNRTLGTGTRNERHIARFSSVCNRAKAMGITIWVIALDVGSTDDIEPCATSSGHFFISDGSDLEEVFAAIGQGIGRLRLTR